MGSAITEEKGLYAALNNCAFVSTESMKEDPAKPFVFLMDLAMLGYASLCVSCASVRVALCWGFCDRQERQQGDRFCFSYLLNFFLSNF